MSDVEEERTINSEAVYSGELFTVRKDTVRLSTGRTTDREILVHPEAVAVIPVLNDEKSAGFKTFFTSLSMQKEPGATASSASDAYRGQASLWHRAKES